MPKKKLINVIPDLYLSENIIILGSGESLIKNNNGDWINSFEEVIRFNRAPTEGYEKQVGNKTTLRVANIHVMRNMYIGDYWPNSGQPTFFIKNLNNSKILTFDASNEEIGYHKQKNNEIFTIDYFKFMSEIKKEYKINFDLSSGLLFILLCIKSGITPTISGFNLDTNVNHYWNHYWEEVPKEMFHDENNETEILITLKNSNKIIVA